MEGVMIMHNNRVEWEYGSNDNTIVFSCNNILLFVAQRIGSYQFKVLNVIASDDIKFIRNHAPDYKTKTDPTKAILSDFVKGKVNRFEWDIKKNPKRKRHSSQNPIVAVVKINERLRDIFGKSNKNYIATNDGNVNNGFAYGSSPEEAIKNLKLSNRRLLK
jgi:hypothetical protein